LKLEVLETLLLEVLKASRIQRYGGVPRISQQPRQQLRDDGIGVQEIPYGEGTIQYMYILCARESLSRAFSETLKLSNTRSSHILLGLKKISL
jgi:hypothetical protein